MGSALLNTTGEQEFAVDAGIAVPTLRRIAKDGAPELRADVASADALRVQVAERLAAHRRRRGGTEIAAATTRLADPVRSGSPRSARIAATVAERYAHTPSYRAFLAAEAERAVDQARAAAEVAATNAQAIADAQQRMLDAFDEAAVQHTAHREMDAADVLRAGSDVLGAAQDEVQNEVDDEVQNDVGRGVQNDIVQAATLPLARAAERNLWPDLDREEARKPRVDLERRIATANSRATEAVREVVKEAASAVGAAGLTVKLYEDATSAAPGYRAIAQRVAIPAHTNRREYRNDDEATALDEEIAFRQAPTFEEPVGPPVPLPANLIEFPRQLVAPRKARPRLAEGPLREEAEAAPGDGQLRIFEVDAAQISTQPVEAGLDTPQWTSIWLDTPPEPAAPIDDGAVEQWQDLAGAAIAMPAERSIPTVQAASIARRAAAGGIDLGIAAFAGLAFAAAALAVFIQVEGLQTMAWKSGGPLLENARLIAAWIAAQTGLAPSQFAVVATVAGASLILLYQVLFFWFSDATPGMRSVRIALCTFDDENPTRRSVRRRLGAMLLSVCALGFGFVWAMLDDDRLTWHDRITCMYLREY